MTELSPDYSNVTVVMVCLQSGDLTAVATITKMQEYCVWVRVVYNCLLSAYFSLGLCQYSECLCRV